MNVINFINFYHNRVCHFNYLTNRSIDQLNGYLKTSLCLFLYIFLFDHSLSFALPSHRSSYTINSHILEDNAWTQIYWEHPKNKPSNAWVPSRVLFDEWHFARYAIASQMIIAFYPDGSPALNYIINKKQRLKIEKVNPIYVQVEFQQQKLWILRYQLAIDFEDMGYLVSKNKIPLRQAPSHKSKVIKYLKPGLRLIPLNFQKGFAQIDWQNKPYFVPLSHVLSRLDFIKKVKINKQWKDVLFVMGHFIKTTDNQFVSISQIKGMQGNHSLAYTMALKTYIRKKPDKKGQIIQTVSQFTPLALVIKDHLKLHLKSQIKSQLMMRTHQLFDRKLFDVASASHIMLASAKGIFKSYDGNLWQRLVFFEDKDFPVAISPTGKIYVGPYRSTDQGKSFQQYIKWDLVFNALKTSGIHAVAQLRIKDIEFLNHNEERLRVTLNIGRDWSQKMKLATIISYDEGKSWRSASQF